MKFSFWQKIFLNFNCTLRLYEVKIKCDELKILAEEISRQPSIQSGA